MGAAELTEEQVTEEFLTKVQEIIKYWHELPDKPPLEMIEGAVFSILATIDGADGELPAFILAPDPHPDDKEFRKGWGHNWYPENHENYNLSCNISGGLHELFGKYKSGGK